MICLYISYQFWKLGGETFLRRAGGENLEDKVSGRKERRGKHHSNEIIILFLKTKI